MPYYFAGGEDHDLSRIGAVSVDTATTAARRTANARCSLKVGPNAAATDGWQGQLSAAVSSFWFSIWFYTNGVNGGSILGGASAVSFLDGTTRRLHLSQDGANPAKFRLKTQTAAGVLTTLATASVTMPSSTLVKLDIHVVYGTVGSVDVYQDNTLIISYSGDVTTNGATTLSGFVLGPCSISSHYFSEVLCTTDDTRGLSLVTLPPAANGNAFAWSNSYASLDEVTLDDTDLSTSSAANDIAETTVTSSGITGTPAIRAVCVSARAQKGGTGPQNIQAMVRTGGNDYVSGTIALPPAFNRVANIWETNPATSGAWAYTDLTAAGFNIGVKSIT